MNDALQRLSAALADRYRIERELGHGGMATVYLGHDLKHERDVARTVPPFEHWRASPRGGEEPVWSPAGDLIYREGNRWMSVSLPNNPGARPGVARFLFTGQYLNVLGRSHDIAPDGRYLLIAGPTEVTTTALTVVTNWVDRLPKPEVKR